VGPRAGLDDVAKGKFFTSPGLEPQPLGRPVRSQSLYRLRYPGSKYMLNMYIIMEILGRWTPLSMERVRVIENLPLSFITFLECFTRA
jgi:hypothetical protein